MTFKNWIEEFIFEQKCIPWRILNSTHFIKKIYWKVRLYRPSINFPLKTYEAVYRFYLIESQRIIDFEHMRGKANITLLKTDLYNEAHSRPDTGGIVGGLKRVEKVCAIEIREDVKEKGEATLKKTELSNYSLEVGDIRRIPYAKSSFDIILDLSTIDHIAPAELELVFSEYERVMKEDGVLILITWVDVEDKAKDNRRNREEWGPTHQYYFNKEEFIKIIDERFNIEKQNLIFYEPKNKNHHLTRFICRKKICCKHIC
ncbi:MAG: class I SAM-dependent methyltransferase [Patescibacteria group bacterium]